MRSLGVGAYQSNHGAAFLVGDAGPVDAVLDPEPVPHVWILFLKKGQGRPKANQGLLKTAGDNHAFSPWQDQRPIDRRASQGRNESCLAGPTAHAQGSIGYPVLESSLEKLLLPGQQMEGLAS